MIESLAKTYADTSGIFGLVLFGCFAIVIVALCVLAYVLVHVLASLQDDKALRFASGLYRDRRHSGRVAKFGLLIKTVRRIRGVHDKE